MSPYLGKLPDDDSEFAQCFQPEVVARRVHTDARQRWHMFNLSPIMDQQIVPTKGYDLGYGYVKYVSRTLDMTFTRTSG